MKRRLTIVQNRPTQFDMPLYACMHDSGEWDLQVIYTDVNEIDYVDRELGRAPRWDHVPAMADRGVYLSASARRDVKGLVEQIAVHRPELVILCGYYPWLHTRLVGPLKRRGVKIGLRSDNTLPHGDFSGWKGLAKRLLLPFWLARYDSWHPVGSLAQQYLEKLSRVQRPAYPFPYAVDVDWFEQHAAAVSARRAAARAELGLSLDQFVVLGILKWHPREDPLTLLRAFAALHKRQPQARLVLIGEGPLRDEVQRQAGTMGGAVILPGYQPYSKLPLFYAISDVFVHPSIDEPWGVSVQEALACGLPVLVAEGVGARFDLLEDGVTGWNFPNGVDATLAERLEELARDRALLKSMSTAANTHAHKLDYAYSLAQFSAAIEELPHRH
jgi:glycosyltransferase involved in cell wall biosynthesis